MPLLFIYLLKLSVSLAVMYLFYQLLLRRLTFYNHNRWYLIGYSLLCFFIPFINISSALEKNETVGYDIVTFIPSVENFTAKVSPVTGLSEVLGGFTIWSWLMILLIAGSAIMLVRFALQFFSFQKIKRKALLISDDDIKFYQVDKNIIPFSFGNSIFINQQLHTEAELKEIIRHEFVHVKQRHTIDIIWAEVLCILNWYNPFAWLIRKAVRQNLEFIADNRVLANGMDKKEYQYLLLKVIGNNHFRIVNQFNFSSLKKRIVMMNKMKTARVHLIKFLFVLPLLAIVLFSFRGSYMASKRKPIIRYASMVIDLETNQPLPGVKVINANTGLQAVTDEKGYFTMELPADNPIHVKMNFNKEGYSGTMTSPFSLERKNNAASIGMMEIIAIHKGRKQHKCTGCNSSISMLHENKADIGYTEVRNYYESHIKGWPSFTDTVPDQTTQNTKGYYIDIKDNKGNCTVVVKDKNNKEVKRLLLTEWNKEEKYYEDLYGEILSPPSICEVAPTQAIQVMQVTRSLQPVQPVRSAQPTRLAQPVQPAQPVRPAQSTKAIPAKPPVRKANYVEKQKLPQWDIRNFLVGKKKDDC